MKIEIKTNEYTEVLVTCLNSASEYIKQEVSTLVIHNGEGSHYKLITNDGLG